MFSLLSNQWCRVLPGVAVACVLPVICNATENDTRLGWYAGGGITASNVFAAQGFGLSETSERGSSDTGFVINVGYRWTRNIAFELGYLDGGAPTFRSLAFDACITVAPCQVTIEQETTAFEASVLGLLPLGDSWEIYMKGGVALWDANSAQRIAPIATGPSDFLRFDTSGTDFMLGIGAGIRFGDRTHARFEYQAFRTNDALLLLDSDREARFDQFSLELYRRF